MNLPPKHSILFAENNVTHLGIIKALFQKNYDVHTVKTGDEALTQMKQDDRITVVVADQVLPDMSGIALLDNISRNYGNMTTILLTESADPNKLDTITNNKGISDSLSKPFDVAYLKQIIDNATKKKIIKTSKYR